MQIINHQHLNLFDYFKTFSLREEFDLFSQNEEGQKTRIDYILIQNKKYPRFINEFWTSKQRQASSLHEISYRACFKPQLPRFFIELFTKENDTVYDPFSGRGTTIIEAGLLGRNVIGNDVNPLSKILSLPRFFVPNLKELEERLKNIKINDSAKSNIDLSMFYHRETEKEITSLKRYLKKRKENSNEDRLDSWIRMVATNRLTGHSSGFFSVYTLPPNQAVSRESQIKINEKRNQKPSYRNTREIILKKSKQLMAGVLESERSILKRAGENALFFNTDARFTKEIPDREVQLTVTSPPFLDVVQYDKDNWLRCWFNSIDEEDISKKITMSKTIDEWCKVMAQVFSQLYRLTKNSGWVAFEVGEVRNGKYKLDEYIVPLGVEAGFTCEGILINEQKFTKTANIWGINNNDKGTNTNRVVLFRK
ncbi:MAG: DNA methyltransferase [Elusimicrobia bacterium]|nr:DNA methyltransferase [Elusimicrobiota bacterium]